MEQPAIRVPVLLDAKRFYHFAVFESLLLPRLHLKLLLFVALMLLFAVVNLLTDAALLFWILLAIGLLTPAIYLWQFHSSVKKQIERFGLTSPRHAYDITLDDTVRVCTEDGKEQLFAWDSLYGVFHRSDCLYLFVKKNQAFILPVAQLPADELEQVWQLCRKHVPAERLHIK